MEDGTRWARVTPDDHSGMLYIVTFIGFTYSGLTFLARLLIKWRLLGTDDLAMLLAQIVSIIQFSLLLTSMSAGLARTFGSLDDMQYARMASTYAGAQVAIYVSLGLSKLASILLVRRLFIRDMKNVWVVCNIIIGTVTIWTLVSAVLVSAGCTSGSLSPRTPSEICPSIQSRYMFVLVTDCMTDAILAFIPTYLCRNLQMNMFFKLQVLGIFTLRLPLLAFAILFYKSWTSSLYSENPGVSRSKALAYQQSQLCFSLISATVPCLKSFIQSFDTGSGQRAGIGYSSYSGGYGHISTAHQSAVRTEDNSESYQMSCLARSKNTVSDLGHNANTEGAMRVNKKTFDGDGRSAVDDGGVGLERRYTQESDRKSQHSTQELVIRKEVQFNVEREPARKGNETHRPGLL